MRYVLCVLANKTMSVVRLEPTWKAQLADEFTQPYMQQLKCFLQQETQRYVIYPRGLEYFAAMNLTPFYKVKVVILGQDPYHGEGQAHGLSFSVKPGVSLPPSLVNIYKELKNDLGIAPATHGFLTFWAQQGVFLLNSVLTVRRGDAASHRGRGWECFTDAIICALNRERERIVFILWGSYAQKKGNFIDRSKHHVISAPHPSPLSAHRGFFGSQPFSRTNHYLTQYRISPINWKLPE